MTRRDNFVGRQNELRMLAQAWQDSASVGLVRCVVSGEAGIGRTALLGAFAHAVEHQGGQSIRLVCRRPGHEESAELADDLTHALATLLPDENAHRADLLRAKANADPERNGAQAEATRAAIDALTGGAPLLLTVDDAHHGSASSLACLRRVVEMCARLPVVLVLSVRLGEPAEAERELAGLLLAARATTLGGLTEQQATTMLRARLGHGLGSVLAAACHRVTAGNPFLLDALAERLAAASAFPDPATLSDVVLAGVAEHLLGPVIYADPLALRLVRVIAVAGRFGSVDTALVAHVSGLGLVDALETLDLLVRMRLLTDSDALELRHPLLRAALTGGMTLMARNVAHLTIATYLHEHGAPADVVAAHLSASTVPHEGAWPAGVLLQAAARARSAGHHKTVRRYLELVVHSASGHEQSEAMIELADLRVQLDQASGLKAMVGMLPKARDEFVLRRLVGHIGRVLYRSVEEEQSVLDATGAALANTALRGWERTYRVLSRAADESPPAAAEITGVLAEHLGAGGGSLVAAATGMAAFYRHLVDDDPRMSLRWARAALDHEVDELDTQPLALVAALSVLVDGGYPAEAAQHLTRLDDIGYGDRYTQRPDVLFVRAQIAFGQGDLAAAESHLGTGLAGTPSVSDRPWSLRTRLTGLLAHVLLSRGRNADVEALLRQHEPESQPDSWWHWHLVFAQTFLYADGGDLHRAGQILARLRENNAAAGLRVVGSVPWRIHGVALLDKVGHAAWARQLAEAQVRFAEGTDSPIELGRGLRALAQVSDMRAKERLLRDAVALLEPTRSRLDLAHAAADLGRVLAKQKHREEALAELTRAVRLADQCGAAPLGDRIRQQILALDEHSSLRGILSLTARERQILIDAIRGMTNRRISDFREITVRTVELHLSSAYRKLGISGRTDFPSVFRNRALWILIADGDV